MWNWIPKLHELEKTAQPYVITTLVKTSGATPRDVGAKMIVLSGGEFFGTIGGGELEKLVLDDAKKLVTSGCSKTISYDLFTEKGEGCGGTVDVLFEVMNTGPHLYIFGAGHVGHALCHVLRDTPFTLHLIDEREEWVHSKAVSPSVLRHQMSWQEFTQTIPWDTKKTYIAIMTPHHKFDQHIVERVVPQKTRYVGLMGSVNKWTSIKQQLLEKGIKQSDLDRVHCPIGLPIGGKSPPEIAISIASELLKDFYGN